MDDHLLSSLLSQFEVERPQPDCSIPGWDLALVLHALHAAPFEPLARAPLWALTFKTVFLIALASAKRCSELHAFSHRVQHPEDWSSITLLLDPLFVAKTERACHRDTRLQEVTLKALSLLVGLDLSTDANNCVVHAVKIYLSRTKAFRRGRKRLLISYKLGHQDEIKAPTISSWLVTTVRYVYEHMQDQTARLYHVKDHDLRAFATSWNALQKVSTRDILRTAQWRSHNTFTAFYLVNLSVIEEDMYKIGPLVTAHHITRLIGASFRLSLASLSTTQRFTPLLLGVRIGVLLLPARVSTFVPSFWLDFKQCIFLLLSSMSLVFTVVATAPPYRPYSLDALQPSYVFRTHLL